jgi:hypothetical protein
MKIMETTAKRQQELEESERAVQRLMAESANQPDVSTRQPSEEDIQRFHQDLAWGHGWRIGHYHPDDPVKNPYTEPDLRQRFEDGMLAGFEAIEILEKSIQPRRRKNKTDSPADRPDRPDKPQEQGNNTTAGMTLEQEQGNNTTAGMTLEQEQEQENNTTAGMLA